MQQKLQYKTANSMQISKLIEIAPPKLPVNLLNLWRLKSIRIYANCKKSVNILMFAIKTLNMAREVINYKMPQQKISSFMQSYKF